MFTHTSVTFWLKPGGRPPRARPLLEMASLDPALWESILTFERDLDLRATLQRIRALMSSVAVK